METIPKKECRKIGFLRKTHGIKGELLLEFESDFKNALSCARRFFVDISGLLVPFFVSEKGVRIITDKTALIDFCWIEDEEHSHRLAGREVYLFNHEIPEEPDVSLKKKFTGYMLADKHKGEVGIISRVDDYSDNIVLSVSSGDEDILVPFNKNILVSVYHESKILTLDLPAGILK